MYQAFLLVAGRLFLCSGISTFSCMNKFNSVSSWCCVLNNTATLSKSIPSRDTYVCLMFLLHMLLRNDCRLAIVLLPMEALGTSTIHLLNIVLDPMIRI